MTIKELQERQGWTLEHKIDHSLGVLDQFISHCGGKDKVYISFSGGKDSTVLLHLARRVFGDDIKAVFCNTGNEFPDIIKFVNHTENCETIRPKLKPREVIAKYGFPLISKDVSAKIRAYQNNPTSMDGRKAVGALNLKEHGYKFVGEVPKKFKFLLYSNIKISDVCCQKLKKDPFKSYEKKTGLKPILGIMASESRMRTTQWTQYGCNEFITKRQISKPLSIWTDKDIWDYIEKYNVPIADIYHKGAKRTGCMFCGFGCHMKGDNRFTMLMGLYPKVYEMCLNYTNNGVTYREALRKVLAVNDLTLPDEDRNLFNQ